MFFFLISGQARGKMNDAYGALKWVICTVRRQLTVGIIAEELLVMSRHQASSYLTYSEIKRQVRTPKMGEYEASFGRNLLNYSATT